MEKRVRRFIGDPRVDELDALALAAFRWQCEHSEPLRRLCSQREVDPAALSDWRRIPMVPARAFKSVELGTREAQATFRSSGTTGAERSVHPHGFLDLYRTVIDATFPDSCLPGSPPLPMLSLVPPRRQVPESSLSFMIDHVLERYGDDDSATAFGPRGVELVPARTWLGAAQRHRRPTLVVATGFSLLQLLEVLERRDLRFRLPAGSALFETGGTKGRTREVSREELLRRVAERLALPADRVVREYGMTELTSQFYTGALAGGDPDLFLAPHWVRVRILDPATLEEAQPGRTGLIAVLDLANLSSAVHVLTEDLGLAEENGFRLAGRAAGAELRGCSLLVEELAAG
ncbi:MAG: hypothetical protein ACRD2Z_15490 [Thermoanaerobaculia bacterium]